MEVSNVQINEALPPDTFRFAGMNIPAGWPVRGSALPEPRKLYEWDGNAIIDPGAKKAPPVKMSSATEPPNRATLLTAAGGLSVCGAVVLGVYFWKRVKMSGFKSIGGADCRRPVFVDTCV